MIIVRLFSTKHTLSLMRIYLLSPPLNIVKKMSNGMVRSYL